MVGPFGAGVSPPSGPYAGGDQPNEPAHTLCQLMPRSRPGEEQGRSCGGCIPAPSWPGCLKTRPQVVAGHLLSPGNTLEGPGSGPHPNR